MVGFGPAKFGGVQDEDRLSYDFYIGRVWEAASRAAIISTLEVTSDFEDNHMADLTLGANFYALPTDFSPYIGGAFGFGAMRGNSNSAFGFTARGSIGALLFRTSTAQLNVEGARKCSSGIRGAFPFGISGRFFDSGKVLVIYPSP